MKTLVNTHTVKTGLLLALACAAFPAADAQQGQQGQQGQQLPQGRQADFSGALRELNIMSNIFAATLEEDRDNRFPSFGRSPDALYLAGQGMVFTFNLNNAMFPANFGGYFRQFGADMQRLADDVMNELSASFPDVDFDFDFDFDYDDDNGGVVFVPPAPAPAPGGRGPFIVNLNEARNEQREAMQEMMEEMRDQQREVQELQRDLRELQRDLRDRDANVASTEERIRQTETRIAEETATLESQRQAYQRFVEEYEVRRREQVENLNRELTAGVVTTLCDYGATLRSLENGEHVTLIFENYAEDEDQVYVFDYQDLASCESADSLLASAIGYRIPN